MTQWHWADPWTNSVSLSLSVHNGEGIGGGGGLITTWRCLNQKAGEPAQQHEACEGMAAAQPVQQEVRKDVGGDLHRSTVHMKRQETYCTYSELRNRQRAQMLCHKTMKRSVCLRRYWKEENCKWIQPLYLPQEECVYLCRGSFCFVLSSEN